MKDLTKKIVGIFVFVFSAFISFSQTTTTDSVPKTKQEIQIENLLQKADNAFSKSKVDSVKIYYNLAIDLAQKNSLPQLEAEAYHGKGKLFYALNQKDTALTLFKKAEIFRRKANDLLGLNKTLGQIGQIYLDKGMNMEGFQVAKDAIEVGKQAKYDRGTGIGYLNGGNFLRNLGRNEEALEYYQNASKYFDKAKFDAGVGMCFNSIANIYNNLENVKFAIEYYQKSLTVQQKTGNKKEYANTALNLGTIYMGFNRQNIIKEHRNTDSMFLYFQKSIEIFEEIGDIQGIVKANSNLGLGYMEVKKFDQAKRSFDNAYKNAIKNNLFAEIINVEKNYGILNHKMGKYKEAKSFYLQVYPKIIQSNLKEEEWMWYRDMAINSDSLREYKESVKYWVKFNNLQDTLRNNETEKVIAQLGMRYGSELKDQEIASAKERQQLMQEKNDVMQKRLYIIVIGLVFIAIFLILVFYLFIQKRKANSLLVLQNEEILQQKEEIEVQRNQVMSQKDIIEEQQKNIIDSIHYACKIQEAILPQQETIDEMFAENLFVLFKPRDIVSGDFYWLGRKGNKKIIVAADCTGHGVPGAFMSMLGTAFLNEIVSGANQDLIAADVLNRLREYIIVSLRQTGKSGEQKDGMDLTLCIYDEEAKVIDFSGANNPILIVRKKSNAVEIEDTDKIKVQEFISDIDAETYQVIQIQGDKMPIGIFAEQRPFESVSFQLQESDSLYTFSDGYQDQFGGEKNKKFMVKRLKQLIVNLNAKPMLEQKEILDKTLVDWIEEAHTEQVDDILLIGLSI